MLEEEDAFLWIETVWTKVSLTRLPPSLMNLEFRGTVEARGWVYLSQDGENAMVIDLVLGNAPDELFRKAEREVVWVACQRTEMEMENIEVRVELGDRGNVRRPVRTMRCVLPPFLVDAVFGTQSRLVQICQSMTTLGLYQCAKQDFFRLSVEMRPFEGNWSEELAEMLNCLSIDNVFVPSSVHWGIVCRNVAVGETFLKGVNELFYNEEDDFSDEDEELGKMVTEDETNNRRSEEGPGLGGSAVHSEEGQKDKVSINPDGTKRNRKKISSGENSGKAGGSKQGTQETREGRNKDRTNPQNSDGAVSKKVRITDVRRKLAKIEKRTAEYKARLIEEMMTENEDDPPQEVPRDDRKVGQGGSRRGGKDSDRGGTPSKRRNERENSPGMEAEKATNPPTIDSMVSRLPATPAAMRGCEGLWSLWERVLGWFDPEGTAKTREGQRADKGGQDTSTAGEASSSEGGLKKIVSSLARALNKNQGYLAGAKKKMTFDRANITEFLIDYENLAALLKWTEEEKIDHLGQHVSLSLGRDIIAIVAPSRSWKETRDVMMRKYLAAKKMATEADLAAFQRKNFATYVDGRGQSVRKRSYGDKRGRVE
ncbi:hypothetical protein CBR_g38357 [Chara braunii]|uniref:Uncharacterized protein n=1 Tax=Chara braunii TaxID=69332 RepID=A0A388LPZ1_CHABU|nr:hypothetical protein CBR_g38357 [Chara braunii]|eukprot:GBG84384.1 hypothetical protein CBR_g38357 [Chara braunii]